MKSFYVEWESMLPGANERLNPGSKDWALARCGGVTRIEAESGLDAKIIFGTRFPGDRVLSVR